MTDAEDKQTRPPPEGVEDETRQPAECDLAKRPRSRCGFLAGRISVPDDFDTMMRDEIERMFYGEEK